MGKEAKKSARDNKNKSGIKTLPVTANHLRKDKTLSREACEYTVSKESYRFMEDNWGKD